MKKEEKTRISKERILQAAMAEFGKNSYEDASMSDICVNHGLSKGLIYHNYLNKEQLYLAALKRCSDEMVKALSGIEYEKSSIESLFMSILKARQDFLNSDARMKNIYYYSIYMCPESIEKEVRKIDSKFYEFLISSIPSSEFRDNIEASFVLEYLLFYKEIIKSCVLKNVADKKSIEELAKAHEEISFSLVDTFLFGVAIKH